MKLLVLIFLLTVIGRIQSRPADPIFRLFGTQADNPNVKVFFTYPTEAPRIDHSNHLEKSFENEDKYAKDTVKGDTDIKGKVLSKSESDLLVNEDGGAQVVLQRQKDDPEKGTPNIELMGDDSYSVGPTTDKMTHETDELDEEQLTNANETLMNETFSNSMTENKNETPVNETFSKSMTENKNETPLNETFSKSMTENNKNDSILNETFSNSMTENNKNETLLNETFSKSMTETNKNDMKIENMTNEAFMEEIHAMRKEDEKMADVGEDSINENSPMVPDQVVMETEVPLVEDNPQPLGIMPIGVEITPTVDEEIFVTKELGMGIPPDSNTDSSMDMMETGTGFQEHGETIIESLPLAETDEIIPSTVLDNNFPITGESIWKLVDASPITEDTPIKGGSESTVTDHINEGIKENGNDELNSNNYSPIAGDDPNISAGTEEGKFPFIVDHDVAVDGKLPLVEADSSNAPMMEINDSTFPRDDFTPNIEDNEGVPADRTVLPWEIGASVPSPPLIPIAEAELGCNNGPEGKCMTEESSLFTNETNEQANSTTPEVQDYQTSSFDLANNTKVVNEESKILSGVMSTDEVVTEDNSEGAATTDPTPILGDTPLLKEPTTGKEEEESAMEEETNMKEVKGETRAPVEEIIEDVTEGTVEDHTLMKMGTPSTEQTFPNEVLLEEDVVNNDVTLNEDI